MMISSRLEAIHIARTKLDLNPLYLDTETTGIERNSEIIEVCIVDDQGQLVYESLVKPTRPIPRDSIRIHGITDQDVKNAPSWMVVWPEVQNALTGRNVGIYNAEFDLRMIQQTHALYRMTLTSLSFNYFCIMKLYAQYYGEWNRVRGGYRLHSLEDAGRHFRIPLHNTHRALDDSLLARAVLHYIAEDTGAIR